jgi:hypothetical protein
MTALFVLVMLSGAAMAQETGQISGTVTDPNGALVPGATVVVKSVGTGAERSVTTGTDANYLVTNLQPGLYDVSVTGAGFGTSTQRAQVTVGGRLTLDFNLSIGATPTATVEVVAGSGGVEVNTTDQQISTVVNNTQIRELPTVTRNAYDLISLSGNVSVDTSLRGTGYAINGQRAASTSILLDGAENVDTFTAGVGQAVPLDSVQEFRVISGNFSAEYGRASGGIVNVATIAGSNSFHGTAYEFNRISKLASNGYDNNARGIPRAVFTRNQFGYSIGGPILKNKLFFFSNTEWIRVRSGGSRVAFVPTSQLLNASAAATRAFFAPYTINGTLGATVTATQVITGFGGTASCITDPAATCAAFGPTPNAATNAFLAFARANPNAPAFQQVTFSTPRDVGGGLPEDEYQTVERIDYVISDKSQLYGRYALQKQNFFEGTNAYSPYQGFSTGTTSFNQNFLLTLTHTFTSNFVSQSKLGFNRLNGGQPLGEQPLVPTLYLNGSRAVTLNGVQVLFPGYLPYSPGNAIPFNGAQNLYQLNQDFTYTTGKHTWKMGGQIVHIRDNKTFGAYSYAVEALGSTNGESLSNFVTGNLLSFSVAIDPGNRFPGASIPLPVGPPSFSRSNRYTEWALYLNDSYRVSPRVTLNLGLRYEYYGVQHNADPTLDANFYYGAGETQAERIRNGRFQRSVDSAPGGLWNPDKNNFAPRVGFAWDIFGDGRTSLRGGYGVAYERNFGNVTFNVLFNPPNYGVVALTANRVNPTTGLIVPGDVPTLPVNINNYGPFSGTGPARTFTAVSARHVDENVRNAYAHFWSASFEHQLGANTVASLEYSGSAGRSLYSIGDQNRTGCLPVLLGITNQPGVVAGTTTNRCNIYASSMNTRRNDGYSNYNALIASLNSNNFRNMGLTFTARYTYSVAKDNLSSTFAETGQTFFLGFTDQYNPQLDYGYADFDVRHRFSGSINYEVPFRGDSALARHLLGGWSVNSTVVLRTGFPITIYDCSFGNVTCARINPSSPIVTNTSNPPAFDPEHTSNSFTLINLDAQRDASGSVITPPTPNPITGDYNFGPYGPMTARNAFRGPGFWNVDLGIYKRIRFNERLSMQLRGEIFNLFNHANLYTDYSSADVSSGNVLGRRGVTDNLALERRNVQLAVKFIF